MATCCFLGHSNYCSYSSAEYKAKLTDVIENLIVNHAADTFYCGRRGDFDLLCWRITSELINKYPQVKIYHVLSYIPTDTDERSTETKLRDEIQTVYLLEEYVPPKYAIARTNQCMVDLSDYIVTGVDHTYGGANAALEYAEKRQKKIIYLNKQREEKIKREK